MIVVRTARPRSHARRRSDLDDIYGMLMASGGAAGGGRPGRLWRPPIDVYVTDDAVEVVAELAGLDTHGVELVIDGDVLSLRGQRVDQTVCDRRSFHEVSIQYGTFAADIFIPMPVDSEGALATYESGFLRISLPLSKGRTITPTRAASEPGKAALADVHDGSDA